MESKAPSMHARASQSLVLAVLLHLALAGLMFWLMVGPAERPFTIELPPRVFQEQAFPSDAVSTTPSSLGPVIFTPVAPPVRILQTVSEAEVATPPVVAPPSTPKPPVTTRTQTARTSAATTIAEHRAKHPAPAQSSAAAPAPQGSVAPRINVDEVLGSGASHTSPGATNSSDNRDAQADYLGRLLTQLRAAHQKPEGLGDELQVKVEFVLKANGTIGDVRILKSSGDAAFDASVLAAFRSLRALGVPPAGVAGLNQVTFRTRVD